MYDYVNGIPIVPIDISPIFNSSMLSRKQALVDSGAFASCITPSIIKEFSLSPIRKRKVGNFDGEEREAYVYLVNIIFHGMVFPKLHVIGLTKNDTQIIGRDILNRLHICLDGKQGIMTIV